MFFFFLQAARWPPLQPPGCSGIAADTDILAVGINGVECCVQGATVCVEREKTDRLFELAACLEKS